MLKVVSMNLLIHLSMIAFKIHSSDDLSSSLQHDITILQT